MTEREVMSDNRRISLEEAIATVRSGRRDEAVRMLRQVVADDPFAVDGWIWLGGVATDPHEQRAALERALTIAPQNQRAHQGLSWLRQTHPEVFDTPSTAAVGATLPLAAAEADRSHQAAVYETADQPRSFQGATIYDAPTQANTAHEASMYEASTQAMPATYRAQSDTLANVPPFQTDRMPVQTATSAPAWPAGGGQTDRMTAVPAPQAMPEETVVERRSPFANFSRWVILTLYLLSFGAAATLAALTLWDNNGFVQVANGILAQPPLRAQLAPATISTTYWSTVAVLVAVAMVDLMLALGFIFRQRWAWWVNLLLATLALAGAIALLVPDFTFPAALIGGFSANNGVVQALGGMTIFSALFWLLSVASRRAFYPRRIVQYDGR